MPKKEHEMKEKHEKMVKKETAKIPMKSKMDKNKVKKK
jgi:hypothetical protein